MPRSAERHALRHDGGVGPLGVIRRNELGNVDEDARRRGFAGERGNCGAHDDGTARCMDRICVTRRRERAPDFARKASIMNLFVSIGPLIALIAGILILIMPRLLNYIVAIYLILVGVLGLFGSRLH